MTTQNFKTDLQAVKFLIKQSGSSTWQLEKLTGISRQTFDRWKKVDSLDVRGTTMQDFAQKLGYTVKRNYNGVAVSPHNQEETGELTMNQQTRLIDYQENEIQQLKKENTLLKENNIIKAFDDGTEYHFSMQCQFKLNLFKMSVDIMYQEPCSDFKYICHKLGYSENELRNNIFSFGKMMNYKEHTIHQLRTANDKEKMLERVKGILKGFSFSKGEIANYDIKLAMIYRSKNGQKVYVQNQYIVDYYAKTAKANLHFMNGID